MRRRREASGTIARKATSANTNRVNCNYVNRQFRFEFTSLIMYQCFMHYGQLNFKTHARTHAHAHTNTHQIIHRNIFRSMFRIHIFTKFNKFANYKLHSGRYIHIVSYNCDAHWTWASCFASSKLDVVFLHFNRKKKTQIFNDKTMKSWEALFQPRKRMALDLSSTHTQNTNSTVDNVQTLLHYKRRVSPSKGCERHRQRMTGNFTGQPHSKLNSRDFSVETAYSLLSKWISMNYFANRRFASVRNTCTRTRTHSLHSCFHRICFPLIFI